MFFQEPSAAAATAPTPEEYKRIGNVADLLQQMVREATNLRSITENVFNTFQDLGLEAEQLNKTFLGNRERLQEMIGAINAAAPGVVKLGGEFKDVRRTLGDIAAGTRTQLIATEEQVAGLFASSKVLGDTVFNIVDAFDKVGISYDQISKRLGESINYVQGIGLNARAVMKDVVANTEQLSRFNFNNGVQGLTKMAAQASMLRFDMKTTFDFADRVLDPEKAVEMASAFQRLGVSVGNLTDPFQLMNQSIMDPSGLQNSLINMTKQFTYFDEQTKSFKINPQGILTMRAIAEETNISATELRKTALAAAEMDSKLTQMNQRGLSFQVDEETKMMVANIARMGTDGQYEVSIKDEKGYEYQKKLTDLQQEDFDRLIKQQQQAPKTIEEIQERQLNTAEKMLSEIQGLTQTIKSAFLGLPGMNANIEGALNVSREVAGALSSTMNDVGFQATLKKYQEDAERIRTSGLTPEKQKTELKTLSDSFKQEMQNMGGTYFDEVGKKTSRSFERQGEQVREFTKTMSDTFKNIFVTSGGAETKKNTGILDQLNKPTSGVDFNILTPNATDNSSIGSRVTRAVAAKSKMEVEFLNPTLNINVNVSAPRGVDESLLTQTIRDAQAPLKEEIYRAVQNIAVNKERVKSVGA